MSFSTNAARAAATLLELGKSGAAGTTLKALSASVGDSKPSMLRCLSALLEYGFAEQIARGRYRLGPSIYALAKAESAVHFEIAKWRPALAVLAEELGQTMHLVRRAGMDVVVIEMQIGSSPVQALTTGVGGRLPIGVGAGSLAIVSSLDPIDRDEIIEANAPRYQQWSLTAETVTRHVEQAAIKGYSSDVGSIFPDWGGLAVPIRERGDYAAIMALSMTAPKSFFDTQNHDSVATHIKKVIANVQGGVSLNKAAGK